MVISDTGMPSLKHPALTYALRGIIAFEITLHGPARDLHSGLFGGAVENPAMALANLLAQVRDKNGRIKIPGFYDGIEKLSKFERQQSALYPMTEAQLKKLVGSPALFGERGFTATEQRSARPTFEINGLTSVIRAKAARPSYRPGRARKSPVVWCQIKSRNYVRKQVLAYLKKICPPTVRMEINAGHGAEGVSGFADGQTGAGGIARAGKSVRWQTDFNARRRFDPDRESIQENPRCDSLLLGLGLPDDNAHSPNEKFNLDCFEKGQLMSAHLWQELGNI